METKLQNALDAVSEALGVERLILGPDGEAAVAIDDVEIGILMSAELEAAMLMAIIGEMPDVIGPELGKVLLSANHLGQMTGGASVGYDAENNVITLNLAIPVSNLDGASLAAGLELVANVTAGWRSNLPVLREIESSREEFVPQHINSAAANAAASWLKM